jgi:hypothetical protein
MYGNPSRPCFYVWDTSGTYYEFGCTADSLQYRNDSNGIHYYRWDVDKIVAPSNGPNASYKMITFYYVQDCVPVAYPCPLTSTVRDAALKQILYGYSTSTASIGTVTGKVDFFYRAPAVPPGQSYWITAYGNNYNGCVPPPGVPNPTTMRCDDPLTYNGPPVIPPPAVMSTLSLQAVTSSVADSGGVVHPAFSYNLTYQDTPFSNSCKNYGQISHELTFHDFALTYARLRSNRLGGRIHYGHPFTTELIKLSKPYGKLSVASWVLEPSLSHCLSSIAHDVSSAML